MEEKVLDFDRDWEEVKERLFPEADSDEAEAALCDFLALVLAN